MKTYLMYCYYSLYGRCRFIGRIEALSETDACNRLHLEVDKLNSGKIYGLFRFPKGHSLDYLSIEIFFEELKEVTTFEQLNKIICDPPSINRAMQ